jgi:hypothetical protein
MEIAIATPIGHAGRRLVVLHTVDLDHQPLRKAHEVYNVRPDGRLATEVMARATQEF